MLLACLAQFMVILDVSVVNVALPAIRSALGFSEQNLQWVVNAYTVTFAGFLLLGGRAADLLGQRRVFVAGLVLFSLASLAGGFADTQALLIAARAAQGLGGAIIAPASLSILTTTFEEGAARNRAVGIWGAMGGAGGAAGVLLGGVLTDLLSWRWILFINVPIGLAAAVLAQRYIAEGASPRACGRVRPGRRDHRHRSGCRCWCSGSCAPTRPAGARPPRSADGGRLGAAGRVRGDRGADRPLTVDAAADLLLADAERGQRGGAAGRRRRVRDVVLPVAVPPASARVLAAEGRPRLPPDDALHRGRIDAGLARRERRSVPSRCWSPE